MTILAVILFGVAAAVFMWPWVDPYLQRRDVPNRLLDRLEEEWDREVDPRAEWTDW